MEHEILTSAFANAKKLCSTTGRMLPRPALGLLDEQFAEYFATL